MAEDAPTPRDGDRREMLQALKSRSQEILPIDRPPQSLKVGSVALIGAGNAGGFGFNLGRAILLSHPSNSVILADVGRSYRTLEKNVGNEEAGYDLSCVEMVEFDVTIPFPLPNHIDHIIVCAAYMDPNYLKDSYTFDTLNTLHPEVVAGSRAVVVDGFRNTVKAQDGLLSGAAWGLSFAGHDFPAYNIGPIKKELEDMVVCGDQILPGIRQNIICFGPLNTVAALPIQDFGRAFTVYEYLGLTVPSLSGMLYGAVRLLSEPSHDREILPLDGGLRRALESRTPRERREQLYPAVQQRYDLERGR